MTIILRDYLDSKSVIIFDTKEGQEVYNEINKTREELVKEINVSTRSEALFSSWLFSMKSKRIN